MAEKKKKILILEDDKAQSLYLSAQLAYFNFDTLVHHSMTDLDQVIEREKPDIILTDIVFPEGNLAGPEHLRRLQENGRDLPPIIALSGRVDFEARLAALRAGARAYYPKPIDCVVVADKVHELLDPPGDHPYHVLIVDDSPSMSAYFAGILSNAGMLTLDVNDPGKALEALCNFPAELILMDIYMPACTGTELAAILRQQDQYVSIPIVFLSSEANQAKKLRAMGSGGDDFLVKPVDPNYLITSVQLRAARYREMRRFMVRDSLTGLLNHSTIEAQLYNELSRARRLSQPLALAMLDVDHFKKVNDTYGHPVGDQVLRNLSRLLQQRLRKTDLIGRYGGEEFCVILPNTTAEQAASVIDEIREAFSKIVMRAEQVPFSVTFSCGVSDIERSRGESLTLTADRALYQAKNEGRNRIRWATPA